MQVDAKGLSSELATSPTPVPRATSPGNEGNASKSQDLLHLKYFVFSERSKISSTSSNNAIRDSFYKLCDLSLSIDSTKFLADLIATKWLDHVSKVFSF